MAPLGNEPIGGQTPAEEAEAAARQNKQEAEGRRLELEKSIAQSIHTIAANCGRNDVGVVGSHKAEIAAFVAYVDNFPTAKSRGEIGYYAGDPELKYWDLKIGDDEEYILPEYGGLVMRPDGRIHTIKYSRSDPNTGAPMHLTFDLVSEKTKDMQRFELAPGVINSKQESVDIRNSGPHTAYAWEGKLGGKEVSLTSGTILADTEEQTLSRIDKVLRLEVGPRP